MEWLFIICLCPLALALNNGALTTVPLPLTVDGGFVRKGTPGYGTFGGREDSLSLDANHGGWSEDDSSESTGGWCAFHSNEKMGEGQSYTVSVDMYPVKNSNEVSTAGIAFNVFDKCTYDFMYFRPHEAGAACITFGSMRGCSWTVFRPTYTCPDGPLSWDQWSSVKVDVTSSAVVVSKKKFGGAWVQTTSVATSYIFGNHPVARLGLLVANGFQSKVYFNRFELQYSAPPAGKTFNFKLEGTAPDSQVYTAKRNAIARFQAISPDLSTNFVAEPSHPTSPNNGALMMASIPLTQAGGFTRKCTVGYGAYGGRQDTLSLHGNFGAWSHDDTSDSTNGFCAFFSNYDMGDIQPYTATVDMYHVKAGNSYSHGGLAFNVIDKCNYDFVYFRPHSPTGCYQVGAMRGCMWTACQPSGACPDGQPTWDAWYSIKVDVAADKVVISKRWHGAEWVQTTSVATSNIFGGHPVARVGLVLCNSYGDTTYFNGLQLEYPAALAKDAFVLELSGTAAVGPMGTAKRATVDDFKNISSDLSVHFSTEPSRPRRLLV